MKLADIDKVRRLADTVNALKAMIDKPGDKDYTLFISVSGSDKRIQVSATHKQAESLISDQIRSITAELQELGVEV